MNKIICVLAVLFCTTTLFAIEKVKPEEVGFDPLRLSKVDDVINLAIAEENFPGAVLAVVKDGKLAYLKAYGNRSIYPKVEPMRTNTVFDLASCSKVVGTAMSMAHLLESGGYRLNDRVDMYIPGFKPYVDPETGKDIHIKIVDLLTHTSGLPSYVDPEVVIKAKGVATPDALMSYICTMKRKAEPGTKFEYSCLNFITLQNILQNITGEEFSVYTQKNIFDFLGMKSTTYKPKTNRPDLLRNMAPTEKQKDGSVLLGEVHDPLARIMNKGNSGNAGVFSTAEDLAILAAALMEDEEYNGKNVLGELTIERMFTVPKGYETFGRSLGWDNYSPYSSNKGDILNQTKTVTHSGYTGTSFVLDTEEDIAIILLANRVHPTDDGSVVRTRALVANIVAGSVVD